MCLISLQQTYNCKKISDCKISHFFNKVVQTLQSSISRILLYRFIGQWACGYWSEQYKNNANELQINLQHYEKQRNEQIIFRKLHYGSFKKTS